MTIIFPIFLHLHMLRLYRKAYRVVENSHAADVKLSEADNSEIWNIVNAHEVKGGRYMDVDDKVLHLWG